MAQWVKDPMLLLLGQKFNPLPRNFHMPQLQKERKKEGKKERRKEGRKEGKKERKKERRKEKEQREGGEGRTRPHHLIPGLTQGVKDPVLLQADGSQMQLGSSVAVAVA